MLFTVVTALVAPVGARPDGASAQAGAALVPPRAAGRSLRLPIINLGLPKSGSTSIRDFFSCGNLTASHFKCHSGPCGMCVDQNLQAGRPALHGCGDYHVWAQLDWAPIGLPIQKKKQCFFPQLSALKELHTQFPEATFVLPTRPPRHWIASVDHWQHADYRMREVLAACNLPGLPSGRAPNDSELADFYVQHSRAVRTFVANHPSHTLIEFDLEEPDVAQKLALASGVPAACWSKSNCKASCNNSVSDEPGHSRRLAGATDLSATVQLAPQSPSPSPLSSSSSSASPAPLARPSPSPTADVGLKSVAPKHFASQLNLNQFCVAAHRREEHASHFYHFFLGEFLPIIASIAHAERANPGAKVLMHLRSNLPTDSRLNPLMRFYSNLEETHPDLAIIRETYTSDQLRGQMGCLHTRQGDSWDFGTNVFSQFNTGQLAQPRGMRRSGFANIGGDAEAIRLALTWLKVWSVNASVEASSRWKPRKPTDVLVQLREEVLPLMDVGLMERGHGQARVSGLESLATELRDMRGINAETFFGDALPLNEQMKVYTSTHALVAGHGAGMVWSLFLPPKSTFIELLTENKILKDNTALQGFHRIAQVAKASSFIRVVMKNKRESVATRTRQIAGALRLGNVFVRLWPCCAADGAANASDGSANRLWPQCPYSSTDLSEDPDRVRGPTRFLPFGPRAWSEKTAEMPVPTAICGSPTQCCRCCAPGEESGVQSDLSWEDEGRAARKGQ